MNSVDLKSWCLLYMVKIFHIFCWKVKKTAWAEFPFVHGENISNPLLDEQKTVWSDIDFRLCASHTTFHINSTYICYIYLVFF